MATRIYTRTGDRGETGLWGGERVPKDHPRVEAYGTVDELNAALGQARALGPPEPIEGWLAEIQQWLFELGGELATPVGRAAEPSGVRDEDVSALERYIDTAEAELPALRSFILPAGSPVAASLHVARTVCRRAERTVVALRRLEPQTPEAAVKFLNRLGDLLFVLARLANARAGLADVTWKPRGR